MESAADRANRDIQDAGDRLIVKAIHVAQDYDQSKLFGSRPSACWMSAARSARIMRSAGSSPGSIGSLPAQARVASTEAIGRWRRFRWSAALTAIR